MSDIQSGYIFQPGEKGIDDVKLNSQFSGAAIQPDFYLSKPASSIMDPADTLLAVKSSGAFARISGSAVTSAVVGTFFSPGMMMDFAGPTAPAGWLLCDGTAVNRTTYAALYSALGAGSSPWGQGDGTTTFNLPDYRGRTAIGAGAGPGLTGRALGATGGEEVHVLVGAELADHIHGMANHFHDLSNHTHLGADHQHVIGAGQFSHAHPFDYVLSSTPGGGSGINQVTGPGAGTPINTRNATLPAGGTNLADRSLTTGGPSPGSTTAPNINSTDGLPGSGFAHNNMSPFAVVNKIIKT